LSYQWQFFGTNLPTGTSSVLTISNTQPAQAGNYQAIITNSAGAITSSIASLTVLVPPSISSQPTNETVPVAGTASFSVSATGTAPLTYQWQMAGTNVPGATNSSLLVTNVQTSEAGPYRIIATNAAGAVTSAPAMLRVLVSPTVASISYTGNTATLTFNSISGLVYTLEYKDWFTNLNWTVIPPGATGMGGILLLQDTNATVPNRFYRVRSQ
jgi:hypothetical protein